MLRELRVSPIITRQRSDELTAYLNDIAKYERLTVDEEVELACAIRRGDDAARERFIKANLRFVVSVAKQYQGMGLDLLDLINEGNFGLMKAVDKFDETRGFKFISYAVFEIRAAIIDALSDKSRLVRLPNSQLGVTETSSVSMDAPLSDDSENKTYLDTFASDNRTDACMDSLDNKTILNGLLSRLSPDNKKIICYIFGIGCRVHTEYEVSQIFRCTKERIRQRKMEILNQLKLAAG